MYIIYIIIIKSPPTRSSAVYQIVQKGGIGPHSHVAPGYSDLPP